MQELGIKENFRPKQGEVTVYWRILHYRIYIKFYLSPIIIRMIKLKRLNHAGQVACIV